MHANGHRAAMILTLGLLLIGGLGAQLRAAPITQGSIPLDGPLLALNTPEQDQIVLYNLGSGARRSLRLGDGWQRIWAFSPDGCRLLYTLSDGVGPARLYSAALDGADVRQLVDFSGLPAGTWGVWEPTWSPAAEDGSSRIAFTLIRAETLPDGTVTDEHRIAWVGPDGGAPQFYSVSGDEHTARWSPDGEWLAYVAYESRVAGADIYSTAVPTPAGSTSPAALLREADLWMTRADGSAKLRLTSFATGSVSMPRWSPDGTVIGFVYSPSGNNDQFWMIGSSEGAIPTQLSFQPALALDLTWLPDGSAMIAAARDLRGVAENRLWRIPLIGSADADATIYLDDPALSYADHPRFSPDGGWLALRTSYALALADVTSGTWQLRDDLPLDNTPAVWSPAAFAGEAACR